MHEHHVMDGVQDGRPRLFGIAYRMLGSVTEAEDAVQEAFARLAAAQGVDEPAAWLTRVVTNLCIDRLRSAQRHREVYVGPWLPEPLLTEDRDPADLVGAAESLTLAFLVVLEQLSPVQRAVFLLHDVFGYTHVEVAAMLDRSPAAVRKQASRARARLGEHATRPTSTGEEAMALTRAFLAACEGGDLQGLMDLLAPDVVLTSDGGGAVTAARRPVEGADRVAAFLLGLARLGGHGARWQAHPRRVNGGPGIVITQGGVVDSVFSLAVADDRVAAVHVVRNPEKLVAARRDHDGPA